MIGPEYKAKIDAMLRDELLAELAKGGFSIFSEGDVLPPSDSPTVLPILCIDTHSTALRTR